MYRIYSCKSWPPNFFEQIFEKRKMNFFLLTFYANCISFFCLLKCLGVKSYVCGIHTLFKQNIFNTNEKEFHAPYLWKNVLKWFKVIEKEKKSKSKRRRKEKKNIVSSETHLTSRSNCIKKIKMLLKWEVPIQHCKWS